MLHKYDGLSLIPRNHMVDGVTTPPEVVLQSPHAHCGIWVPIMYAHDINKYRSNRKKERPGIVVHIFNPSHWEPEDGGSLWVQGQLSLREICLKKKKGQIKQTSKQTKQM